MIDDAELRPSVRFRARCDGCFWCSAVLVITCAVAVTIWLQQPSMPACDACHNSAGLSLVVKHCLPLHARNAARFLVQRRVEIPDLEMTDHIDATLRSAMAGAGS